MAQSFGSFAFFTIIRFWFFALFAAACEVSFVLLLRYVAFQLKDQWEIIFIALVLMLVRTFFQLINIRLAAGSIQKWSMFLRQKMTQEINQRTFPLYRSSYSKMWRHLQLESLPIIQRSIFSWLFSCSALLQITLCAVVIFSFPWIFVLCILLLFFPVFLISRLRIKALNKVSEQHLKVNQEYYFWVEDLSKSFESICANGEIKNALVYFKAQESQSICQEMRWEKMQYAFPYLTECLYFFVALILFVFVLPSFSVLTYLFPFVVLLLLLYRPIREWSRLYPEVHLGNESLKKWLDFEKQVKRFSIFPEIRTHDEHKIQFYKVCFAYEKKNVFKNLNYSLNLNQVTGLAGENGLGKTSFLKLLTRLEYPSQGEIIFPKLDTPFIYVSQQAMFSPYWLKELKELKQQFLLEFEKLTTILKVNDLFKRSHLEIHEISGGERQRLHLLQNLLKPYPYALLDEPTTWLTQNEQVEVMRQLISFWKWRWSTKMNEKNYGMLLISHDTRILELCDEQINLNELKK